LLTERAIDNDSTTPAISDNFWVVGLGFTEIVDEALRLPKQKQLELARTLLEKNEASGDLMVESEWEETIERRIRQIDSGLAKGRPFSDVLRDIDKRLAR